MQIKTETFISPKYKKAFQLASVNDETKPFLPKICPLFFKHIRYNQMSENTIQFS